MFLKVKVIFLQHNRLYFFYEGHKRQFPTWEKSFVSKLLRFKKLAFEMKVNFAHKSWTGNLLNRNPNLNFFKTTWLFQSINVLFDFCHFVKLCSVLRFCYLNFPMGRIEQKLRLCMINFGYQTIFFIDATGYNRSINVSFNSLQVPPHPSATKSSTPVPLSDPLWMELAEGCAQGCFSRNSYQNHHKTTGFFSWINVSI